MPDSTESKPAKRGRPRNSGFNIPANKAAQLQAAGGTYADIAQALGISKTAVSRLLTQSRRGTVMSVADRLQSFIDAVHAGSPRALQLLEGWEPSNPSEIVLDRTGQSPLRFAGALLREGTTRFVDTNESKPHPDWWTVRIYSVQATDFRYAVSIEYSTTIRKVISTQYQAEFTDDPAGVIEAYDPLSVLRGFPDSPEYASRQAYLEKSSKLQYGKMVSDLLRESL
jgi:hypothetical protein